ncbi:SRPBCC domain-containing protein [bacterium]|nr:MAG: SRPBCC domain-containing protein [bacterium]
MNSDTFRLRIFIASPLETVWEAWTSPAALGKWFVEAHHDGKFLPGMNYRWVWANGGEETGEVFESNEPVRLAFTFGPDAGVEVTLAPFEGRVAVDLRQTQSHRDSEARAAFAQDCRQGWTFYLTNLKAWLEHGVDLRESQAPELSDLVNV